MAASVPDSSTVRPSDEDILAQQNLIRAEQAAKLPYVGDVEALSSLKAEYLSGSSVFVRKITQMESTYCSMRRTRGDGNCFFRSFIFAYLEGLLLNSNSEELNRFEQCLSGWKEKLLCAGFQELVFSDAMELLQEQVTAIRRSDSAPRLALPQLEGAMRDEMVSNMIVVLLRFITSAEIQRRQEFFAPFIMGMHDDVLDVANFCHRHVEPMGEESDHVHIVALTDALLVPVRVLYLDNSNRGADYGGADAGVKPNSHDFIPEPLASPEPCQPVVHILYRPGHYDILYPASADGRDQ